MSISYKPLTQKERKALYSLASTSIINIPVQQPTQTSNHDSTVDIRKIENANPQSKSETKLEKETITSPIAAWESNYAGDYEGIDNAPLRETGFQTLDFTSPAELIRFYNKSLNSGETTLHLWQHETSESLAAAKPTQQKPHKFCLCACNGSGKDAFVIAPFAVWFCLTKKQSRCIITSSSGVQLTSQTENYIKNLCQAVNEFHGEEIFKIRQRFIRCVLSGSEIRLFATDEEGKAEGYHPIEPNTEMAIIINEAKSVAPEIFRALRRCTGYNYWIEISTPGAPHGDFYKHFTKWTNKRHVSTFDCPHLSVDEREADLEELGKNSAWYRSKHLALFTSVDGTCIIPIESVDKVKAMNNIKYVGGYWPLRIGIDLAAGGDENVITAVRGNRIVKVVYWREKDTVLTAQRINAELENFGIQKNHAYIFADDGGVGHGIIDMLCSDVGSYHWTIARINNQSPAGDKKKYRNRGAENWYRTKRIIEECVFILNNITDDKFFEQLSNRYYKQEASQGRITLESKGEAKANGRPSPDRADSFILALTGLTFEDFLTDENSTKDSDGSRKLLRNREGFKTNEEIQKWQEEQTYDTYGKMNGDGSSGEGKIKGSLNSLLNRMRPRNYNNRN